MMKKWMIAGAGMVFMLSLGGKAYGAELYSHHEGCGRYAGSFAGLESRHNCIGMDADQDVSCHDVIWHYGQYYNGDGSLYCPEHGCTYDDCRGEHDAGHCGGGGCGRNASFADRDMNDGSSGNAGSESEGSGYRGWGNYGSNHHGSGHHGRGHH